MIGALLLYVLGESILSFFTQDAGILAIGLSLLGLNLILQPGKMVNMAMGNALIAIGDTRFVVYNGFFSMWIVAVGLSYVLGIQSGWGLIGIYAAMIADEYLRGLLVTVRWSSKKSAEQSLDASGRGSSCRSSLASL